MARNKVSARDVGAVEVCVLPHKNRLKLKQLGVAAMAANLMSEWDS